MDAARYIRRETRLSMAINAALSLGFYVLFFGISGRVPIAGWSGFAADFVPQSFAITLMSVLVPGVLAARAMAAGRLAPQAGRTILPRSLLLRALLMAVAAASAAAGVAVAVWWIGQGATIGWTAGAAVKIVYGAFVGWIVTPIGLAAALHYGRARDQES